MSRKARAADFRKERNISATHRKTSESSSGFSIDGVELEMGISAAIDHQISVFERAVVAFKIPVRLGPGVMPNITNQGAF